MSTFRIRLVPSLVSLVWAVAAAGSAFAQESAGAAAKTLVLAAADTDEVLPPARALALRVGAALLRAGAGVLSSAQAGGALERLRPLPRATRTTLGGLLAAAQRAFFNEHDTPKARALLEKVRDETSQCDELRAAHLRLALLALTEHKTEEASRHLEALFRADPGAHIEPRDYPPPLRQLGELVRGRLAARGRATVRILAQPAGVRVHVGLCRAGAAPFLLDTLAPGEYEVWADGGRVERMHLSQGANEVRLRVDLDQALRWADGLSLVGPESVRTPANLASLGRALGARAVLVVEARGEGVHGQLIDVQRARLRRGAGASLVALDDLVGFLQTGEVKGALAREARTVKLPGLPAATRVYLGGRLIATGLTPQVALPPGKHTLEFRLSGHEPVLRDVESTLSGTGAITLALSFAPHAWYKRRRPWGFVTLGLSAGLAVAGGLVGRSAANSEAAIARGQDEGWLTAAQHKRFSDGATRDARAANVLFATAGVVAVVGTVLVLLGDGGEHSAFVRRWTLSPTGLAVRW